MASKSKAEACQWVTLTEALDEFVYWNKGTQSAKHIRKLHWYVACRLVIEGGFAPEAIKPRPPFRVQTKGNRRLLHHDASVAAGHGGEATVFGGLKTKNIDVVITLPGIGPVVGVSMKGSLNAFRNLTNRLEEAVGDCTNIHIAYPGFVYGFVHVLRANREGPVPLWAVGSLKPGDDGRIRPPDLAVRASGEPTPFISNFHDALVRLARRRDIRNDHSRYEAITLMLAGTDESGTGSVLENYPLKSSPLYFGQFFQTIYLQFYFRYIYGAPSLIPVTRRLVWDVESPAFADPRISDFIPRIAEDDAPGDDLELLSTAGTEDADSTESGTE